MIYLIGSLRNTMVPEVAARLRDKGFDVFDDWYAAGEIADDSWRDYEKARGRTYVEALKCPAAKHVFEFDLKWLKASNAAVLVLPAGKSSHLELGWMLGQGKRGFVLLDSPDRWDVMYQFATGVCSSVDELIVALEMPYVIKPGEAPRIAFGRCLSCGNEIHSWEEHARCRGAA